MLWSLCYDTCLPGSEVHGADAMSVPHIGVGCLPRVCQAMSIEDNIIA